MEVHRNIKNLLTEVALPLSTLTLSAALLFGMSSKSNIDPKKESAEAWFEHGKAQLEKRMRQKLVSGRAKNAIIFIGDGMGISTVTAARILEGQKRGEPGEENTLSWEHFPFTALAKTYNTNMQTPDSAGTMTAMMTGAKTKAGFISVSQAVERGDFKNAVKHKLVTLFERAEIAGKSTGIVTTARITHATPAACYAHSPDRDWENDSKMPKDATMPDIAEQLITFGDDEIGDGFEVALGGGRRNFFPRETIAASFSADGDQGDRLDGRNLVEEWLEKTKNGAYAYDAKTLANVDVSKTDHLLGLFNRSHMMFEWDRSREKAASTEPSLTDMSLKALEMLEKNDKGFVLMIEAGRIDHAHHAGNAARALEDTVALSEAVKAVMEKVDTNETLVLVTADHSHVFTMAGYPKRGNNILGLVVSLDEQGNPKDKPSLDLTGKPYTTLAYANGPGFLGESVDVEGKPLQKEGTKTFPHFPHAFKDTTKGRPVLNDEEVAGCDYMQEAHVGLDSETHAGEDVGVWAVGPEAHYVRGTMEQHVIFHLLSHALELDKIKSPF